MAGGSKRPFGVESLEVDCLVFFDLFLDFLFFLDFFFLLDVDELVSLRRRPRPPAVTAAADAAAIIPTICCCKSCDDEAAPLTLGTTFELVREVDTAAVKYICKHYDARELIDFALWASIVPPIKTQTLPCSHQLGDSTSGNVIKVP